MFKHMHDQNSGEQTRKVSKASGVEVGVGLPLQAKVETQQQSNEDPWNDDIAQSQHSKIIRRQSIREQILWKYDCKKYILV